MATISYCKYRRKRKQHKEGEMWYDYSPQVYEKGELVACGLSDCEASPSTPPFLPPSSSKYERWITVQGEYECLNGNKYYKLEKQVSDDGVNFTDAVPPVYMNGELIEAGSPDCGGLVEEDWKVVPGDYECVGVDKHEKLQKYEWGQPVQEFKVGGLIEANSIDCGYKVVEWKEMDGEYVCEEKTQYSGVLKTLSANYKETQTDGDMYSRDYSDAYFRYDSYKKEGNLYCYYGVKVAPFFFVNYYYSYYIDVDLSNVVSLASLLNPDRCNTYPGSYDEAFDVPPEVHWDTSNVKYFNSAFKDRRMTAYPYEFLKSLDMRSAVDISRMFYHCEYGLSDLANWDTSNVRYMEYTFADQYSEKKNAAEVIENWNTDSLRSVKGLFYNNDNVTDLDLTKWNTTKLTDMSNMFEACFYLTNVDLSNWNTSNVTNMSYLFKGCSKLDINKVGMSNWNTSNVTSMSYLFNGCSNLSDLDLSNWNTSNVTSTRCMFQSLTLTNVDLSNWDLSNAVDAYFMFNGSTLNNVKLPKKIHNAGKSEYSLFYNCTFNNLALPAFELKDPTNMDYLFDSCTFNNVDFSNFDTSKAITMRGMFSQCSFNGCNPKLDFTNARSTTDMFRYCKTGFDISGLDVSRITNMGGMLVGVEGTMNLSKWYVGSNKAIKDIFYQYNIVQYDQITEYEHNFADWHIHIDALASATGALNTSCKTIHAERWKIDTPDNILRGLLFLSVDSKNKQSIGRKYYLNDWEVSNITFFNGVFYLTPWFDFTGWDISRAENSDGFNQFLWMPDNISGATIRCNRDFYDICARNKYDVFGDFDAFEKITWEIVD